MSDIWKGFPNRLRIAAHTFDVQIVAEIPAVESSRPGHISFGLCAMTKMLIVFRREQPSASYAIDVVFHEIFHALWECCGYGEQEEEEVCVGGISSGLVQVLRDNPKLVSWLTKTLRRR